MSKARKILIAAALFAVVLLAGSQLQTAPQATACVMCPVSEIDSCPPCYTLVPASCYSCGHCEKIRGCHIK